MVDAALVSLRDIKTYIEVRGDTADFDDKLLQLARTATKQLEAFCRREFPSKAITEYFDTRATLRTSLDLAGQSESGFNAFALEQRFPLKGSPVDTGEEIKVYYDPYRLFPESSEVTDTSVWLIDDRTNSLIVQFATATARRAIKVTYTAGYAVVDPDQGSSEDDTGDADKHMSAAAPDDLKMACITQVVFLWNKMQPNSIGTSNLEDGEPLFNADMLCSEAKSLAMPYRRLLVGRG